MAFKLWAMVMSRTWLYELSARVGGVFQRLLVRDGKIGKLNKSGWLAPPLLAWTSGRDLRPIEQKTFRDKWQSELKERD